MPAKGAARPRPAAAGKAAAPARSRPKSDPRKIADLEHDLGIVPEDDGVPEILRFDTSANGHDETRIALFSVDGNVYTVPAHPPMTLGLEVQHRSADTSVPFGVAVSRANDYMMTELLGDEGYAAFRRNCKEKAAFAKVLAICSNLVLGAMEDDPKDS